MTKKIIAVMTCLLIAFISVPCTVFATESENVPPLNDDLYEISTAEQLKWFADFVNAGNTNVYQKRRIVINDYPPHLLKRYNLFSSASNGL